MFFPEGKLRVFLYGQPVDMRKSFDGLQVLARHGLQQDPLDGQLFAFVNRRGTQIKVLYFDRSGWCLWAKRLEAGRFVGRWDGMAHREMDWTGRDSSCCSKASCRCGRTSAIDCCSAMHART